MQIQSIIPILCSADVKESLRYYTEVLGFKNSWEWDEPVTFGGVNNGEMHIYFCKDAQGHPGTWLAINVDEVDEYYKVISEKGAKIINPPQSYAWGMREMLVEDPDGHRIRFGHGISNHIKSEPVMPDHIHILSEMPSGEELHKLIAAVGWAKPSEEAQPEIPKSAIATTALAKDKNTGEILGCAFLLTDNAGFYYIKNVIVQPNWQGKQIGTALLKHLDAWLMEHAPDQSTVALHTGEYLAHFYRQFGFTPAFSMQKKILRS